MKRKKKRNPITIPDGYDDQSANHILSSDIKEQRTKIGPETTTAWKTRVGSWDIQEEQWTTLPRETNDQPIYWVMFTCQKESQRRVWKLKTFEVTKSLSRFQDSKDDEFHQDWRLLRWQTEKVDIIRTKSKTPKNFAKYQWRSWTKPSRGGHRKDRPLRPRRDWKNLY